MITKGEAFAISISEFGLFKVGIEPISLHTVGLMLTALHPTLGLKQEQLLAGFSRCR